MKTFRPMTGASVKNWPLLRERFARGESLWCTPKIDGYRCLTRFLGDRCRALSRSLELLPNQHLQRLVEKLDEDGLDGEIVVRGAKTIGATSSAVMSAAGEPDLVYHVFDCWSHRAGYLRRVEKMRSLLHRPPPWVNVLVPREVRSEGQLRELMAGWRAAGHEGLIARLGDGPYKRGAATEREGFMLKMKAREDSEAVVVGWTELMHNDNPKERGLDGRSKRGTSKEGLRPSGKLGALVCETRAGVRFEIGSGFTDDDRRRLFEIRETLPGRLAKFSHLPHGAKTRPREPVFIDFRELIDL